MYSLQFAFFALYYGFDIVTCANCMYCLLHWFTHVYNLFIQSLHRVYTFSYSLTHCFHVYTLQMTPIWTFLLMSPHAHSRVFLNCPIGLTLPECMNPDFQCYYLLTNLSPKQLYQFSLSPALWEKFCCSLYLPTT